MIGQLNSQVNSSLCMLDYINNYFAVFALYVAMGIEANVLIHVSYLIQRIVATLSGKPLISNKATSNLLQNIYFWGCVLVSIAVICFALAITLEDLFKGQTAMWRGVPGVVSVIMFFLFMSIIGMLEGIQITIFAFSNLPKEERGKAKFAMKTCDLLFKSSSQNLPGFIIARQVLLTPCFFFVALVKTLNVVIGQDENVFVVSDGVHGFFNTGLLIAVITTNLRSILWQILAYIFPLAFLANPLVYILLRNGLLLKSTGICYGS